MLDEIKSMPFSDWYQLVNRTSNYSIGNIPYVTTIFSRNGSISYYVQPAGYDSMSDYPGYESDNN